MVYKVLYFDGVRQDIKEAKIGTGVSLKGLEKRFAEDIKIAITRLKERPAVHAEAVK